VGHFGIHHEKGFTYQGGQSAVFPPRTAPFETGEENISKILLTIPVFRVRLIASFRQEGVDEVRLSEHRSEQRSIKDASAPVAEVYSFSHRKED
jgi:hypothetical protein